MKETFGLIVTIISMIFGIITLADGCCGADENPLINSRGKMNLYNFRGAYIFKKETRTCNDAARDIETITVTNSYGSLQYTYSKIEANCEGVSKKNLRPTTYAYCSINDSDIRKYTQYTLTELANLKTNTAPFIKNPKYTFSVIAGGRHFVGLETSREWEHFNYLKSLVLRACKGRSQPYQDIDSLIHKLVKKSNS